MNIQTSIPIVDQPIIQQYQKEQEVLEIYGFKYQTDYILQDIPVIHKDNKYKIHTFIGGNEQKDTLLLIHGYGGSNVQFGRIYKQLFQEFRIVSIDLPGMGYSSKENMPMTNKEEAMEFFMDTLLQLVQQINRNQKIILSGHSFGGYLSAHLFVRNPEYFKQLILLSPAGTSYYDDGEILQLQQASDQPFWKRMAIKYAKTKWDLNMTPKCLKEKWYGGCLIKQYLKGRIQLKGDEYTKWLAYVNEMIVLPIGSERALYLLLNFPKVIAKGWDSIEYIFTYNREKISKIPIHFYYGEKDWMDKTGAINLVAQYSNIKLQIIQNAGHQLSFENPDAIAKQIIFDVQQQTIQQHK